MAKFTSYASLLGSQLALGDKFIVGDTSAGTTVEAGTKIISAEELITGLIALGINGTSGFRGCMATMLANYTAGTFGTIPFDGTDLYDTDAIHDPSSNNTKLYVPSGVTYVRVGAQIYTTNTVTDGLVVGAEININGGFQQGCPTMAFDATSTARVAMALASGPIPVTGGTDYFELNLSSTDASFVLDYMFTNFWLEILA